MFKKIAFLTFCLVLMVFAAAEGVGGRSHGQKAPAMTSAPGPALISDFGRVPVFFLPNQGQFDDRVCFSIRGADKTIYFAPEGLTLALNHPARSQSEGGSERWVVKLDFLGAREDVKPEGLEKTGASISYFRGKPEEWKAGIPAYSKIIYRDLWPGIDLVYRGELDSLKYEFIVRPGADPSRIKLAYRGAERVALTKEGRLEVKTPVGGFEDDAPLAYQDLNGLRTDIHAAYFLEDVTDGRHSKAASAPGPAQEESREYPTRIFGFSVGEYDRSKALIIDPAVFIYCGYIGGAGEDTSKDMAIDGSGCVYLTGHTYSTESSFPVTAGPDLTYNGDYQVYVAKIDPSGTSLVYCGYIGTVSGGDFCAIDVDGSGNAYVTQSTTTTQSSFPVTVGPDLTHNGDLDAFIAKVDPSGTALVYCGYIGGAGYDIAMAMAVDSAGNAYVVGETYSNASSFPVKVGPDLTFNGNGDAWIAKVNATGSGLDYCGYIGGSGGEVASGVAVDSAGHACVSGHTDSSATSFPVKVGPSLILTGGGGGYVAKVDPSGAGLVYCGYIAGTWWTNIAVDGSGCAYVSGPANQNLPATVGPDLTYNGGDSDFFLAKVSSSGAALVYCGYIGGADRDEGTQVAVDGSNNAYVTGFTYSDESSFPVVEGPDLTYNGQSDAVIAKVDPAGTALVYCGYIGGSGDDRGYGMAVDASGNAYVSGYSASGPDTFPVGTGPDLTYNGGGDAFVAKIGDIPGPPITSLVPANADAGDPGFLLSVIGSDFVDGAIVRWDGSARPTTFISSSELQATIDATDLASGKTVQVTIRNPNGGISNALPFAVHNPLPSLSSMSPTQVTGGGAAFTLTVQGSSFVPNSVVRWNGSARTTTYVSATEIQAAITATDLATGGDVQVTVFNPAPAGGASGALTLQVSSFTVGSTPTSATVAAGQSATYTIQVAPQYGSFDAAVTFSCAGLPSKCTASFAPASTTPGAAAVTTTLTLTTAASSSTGTSAGSLVGATGFGPPFAGLFTMAVILLLTSTARKPMTWRLSRRRLAASALVVLAVLVIGSCSAGGGGDDNTYTGTQKGTHTISVQATSGNMTVPTSVTLVVN